MPGYLYVFVILFFFFSNPSCNKWPKNITEKNISKLDQPHDSKNEKENDEKLSEESRNSYSNLNEERFISSQAPFRDAQNKTDELPDLTGFSGMDPDSFPEGEAGLDAIIELLADMKMNIEEKVKSQEVNFAGKSLVSPNQLFQGLPENIPGWEKEGKPVLSNQKINDSNLPIASRSFSFNKLVTATISIMDTLENPQLRIGYEMGMALTKKNSSPRQKVVSIADTEGYIVITPSGKTGDNYPQSKGALLISDRFLVILVITNLADFEETYRILSSVRISKIRTMGK